MDRETWSLPVRLLPNLTTFKLTCSFCARPAPVSVSLRVDPSYEQTSYLVQISAEHSVHRHCLTTAFGLEVLPGIELFCFVNE